MIDCNECKTEKHHECANMGKEEDSNYDGNCTARHCLSGTYEISRRWIFVGLSVHFVTMLTELTKVLSQGLKHLCSKTKTVLLERTVPEVMDASLLHFYCIIDKQINRLYINVCILYRNYIYCI